MAITISLPRRLEEELRAAFGQDLDRTALESLVIEGYRAGKLSLAQVGRILQFDNRWDVENWLGQRGVNWNYSLDDLAADRATLKRLFGDHL